MITANQDILLPVPNQHRCKTSFVACCVSSEYTCVTARSTRKVRQKGSVLGLELGQEVIHPLAAGNYGARKYISAEEALY